MSHVTKVKVVIKDLQALAEAAEACGCELVEGQKTYKWYGEWVNDYNTEDAAYRQGIKTDDYGKCEHAIRVKGDKNAYEVGVCNNPDGEGYVLVYDFYNQARTLEAKIGHHAERLSQQYKASAVKSAMKAKGFKITKSWENADGSIGMDCEKTAAKW
jgi:hypothetical protein